MIDALSRAYPLADEIRKLRETRNELIHELATAVGRRERRLINERPSSTGWGHDDFETLQKLRHESESVNRQRISETTTQLTEWYALLARASNEVFIVEHQLR